jgi:glycosyltransferase involved in cell wall biosynthesis
MKDARVSLGIPVNVPVACFVGFVQYDLELVIRAFAHARHAVPDARLVLAGPHNPAAQRLAHSFGIRDHVVDLGLRPFSEMGRVMGAADLLLLPVSDNLMNRARGPIKLGDYLAAGRAVLTNPVGDLVDVFRNDEIGAMTGDSPERYGDAMARLLSDRAHCQSLGKRAREVAEQKYAWKYYAPQVEAVYDRAVAGF